MNLKRLYYALILALFMLVFGSMTAFASESISMSETEDVEGVFARNNQQRELVDVVYFRNI